MQPSALFGCGLTFYVWSRALHPRRGFWLGVGMENGVERERMSPQGQCGLGESGSKDRGKPRWTNRQKSWKRLWLVTGRLFNSHCDG